MATDKTYIQYIMDSLSMPDDISYRPMMGEYVVYYKQKVIGGIYNNRFLIKPVKSVQEMLPDAQYETPYEGAKDMVLVEEPENRDFLRTLFDAMYEELPFPKKRAKKG